MTRYRCETCLGEYDDVTDGYEYYHACSPVWDAGKKAWVKRADARNENVDDKDPPPGKKRKEAGKGRTQL